MDASVREGILSLWDEYEQASSPEALAVKTFDKLETMFQHNQGNNPSNFDFEFNLDYGRRYTSLPPLFTAMRKLMDEDTRRNLEAGPQRS
ncbi:HD domain-containing protein [Pseudomonas fluorescens]|uniref:HD domain-containing protein n=1 Tax=Pseudomonas fluorescens TaxID=294 RepID=UPI001BE6B702|nr:HD domain-containing protein [Pseudomonas fluorescens]MBT2372201.1 HD domain-containing protein [Pseudomonas fluorescens]